MKEKVEWQRLLCPFCGVHTLCSRMHSFDEDEEIFTIFLCLVCLTKFKISSKGEVSKL